jgi:hypothetical protein
MFFKKPMRYLKTIIRDVKFLHDFFIYPLCLLRYLLRSKESNFNSIELGKHWQKEFIDSNGTNWRRENVRYIYCDNENYIRYLFKKYSKQYNTILDIGSYDGYFFDSYSCFNKIICADMFVESKEFIEKKFNKKFDFILLNGNDLSNIESDSIDFIFSMHTLGRVPRNVLIKYFKDINRITSKNSFVFIHIPDCFYYNSLNKDFTFISGCKLQKLLSSFDTKIDYTISTISPIIIGEKKKN